MDASVEAAVADAHRREWAFVLAATVRVAGDIDLAEECVQDAYARALTAWPDQGVPTRPAAWLTTVARRRAIDVLRRRAVHDRVLPDLLVEEESRRTGAPTDDRTSPTTGSASSSPAATRHWRPRPGSPSPCGWCAD